MTTLLDVTRQNMVWLRGKMFCLGYFFGGGVFVFFFNSIVVEYLLTTISIDGFVLLCAMYSLKCCYSIT